MHVPAARAASARRVPHLVPLTDEASLRAYAAAYEEASGYRVPDSHLRSSTVLGLMVDGRLTGGGVLSSAEPLRTLQRLPEPARERIGRRLASRRVVEVTCVWLAAGARRRALSGLFWCVLLRRIHLTGADDVLFGTEQPGLHRLYLQTRAELLYQGPVTVDGRAAFGWIFLKPNTSPWPVAARMTLHRARRRGAVRATARVPVCVAAGRG